VPSTASAQGWCSSVAWAGSPTTGGTALALVFACPVGSAGFCLAGRFANDPILGRLGPYPANAGVFSMSTNLWPLPMALLNGIAAAGLTGCRAIPHGPAGTADRQKDRR
jgi:hypothetical protein